MSVEKLKKALEGLTLDFKLEDLSIMPSSDFETLVNNQKTEVETAKKNGEKSGQDVGKQMMLKELKDDLKLDFDKRKDPEAFKAAFKAVIERPEAPDSKETEAQIRAIQEKFNEELATEKEKFTNLELTHKTEADNTTVTKSLTDDFTKFVGKTDYKTSHLVTLAKSEAEFSIVDGKTMHTKNGEVVKDSLLQGVTSGAFVKKMMLDGGYIKEVKGGKIGKGNGANGKLNMEEFIAAQEEQGVDVNSMKFAENQEAAIKAETLDINA